LGQEFLLAQIVFGAQQMQQRIVDIFRIQVWRDWLSGKINGFWRNQQLGSHSRLTGEEVDELFHLFPLCSCPRGKLYSHAIVEMHDAHHALDVYFEVRSAQTQINLSLGRERGLTLHVASADAQVREPTLRERLIFRRSLRGVGVEPSAKQITLFFADLG